MVVRTYEDEQEYLEKINDHCWRIKKGFQPNMNVEVLLPLRVSPLKCFFVGSLLCECSLGKVDAGGTAQFLQARTGKLRIRN